jgi:hypothetical protein
MVLKVFETTPSKLETDLARFANASSVSLLDLGHTVKDGIICRASAQVVLVVVKVLYG